MKPRVYLITADGQRFPLTGMCRFPVPPGCQVVVVEE